MITPPNVPKILFMLFIKKFINHLVTYPTAGNLTYSWGLGSALGLFLALQIMTGLLMATHFVPEVGNAFISIERVMRDIPWGWLLRYSHSNGASFIFILMYSHIIRGLYHQSFRNPRISVWLSGVTLFILMSGVAFLGYILPWGQMSFWGATIITNIIGVIPVLGSFIINWVWGGFAVNQSTLVRFYILHFLLPFAIAALAIVHIALLHEFGSTNPKEGANGSSKEYIKFTPYYFLKDTNTFVIIFTIFFFIVCFHPNMFGHPDNYIPADPAVTPAHIIPEWYFLPFYAILKAIPNKLLGAVAMGGSMAILYLLPFLHRAQIVYTTYARIYNIYVLIFIIDIFVLGWLGGQSPAQIYSDLSLYILTPIYFFYFILVFILSYLQYIMNEKLKREQEENEKINNK